MTPVPFYIEIMQKLNRHLSILVLVFDQEWTNFRHDTLKLISILNVTYNWEIFGYQFSISYGKKEFWMNEMEGWMIK